MTGPYRMMLGGLLMLAALTLAMVALSYSPEVMRPASLWNDSNP